MTELRSTQGVVETQDLHPQFPINEPALEVFRRVHCRIPTPLAFIFQTKGAALETFPSPIHLACRFLRTPPSYETLSTTPTLLLLLHRLEIHPLWRGNLVCSNFGCNLVPEWQEPAEKTCPIVILLEAFHHPVATLLPCPMMFLIDIP